MRFSALTILAASGAASATIMSRQVQTIIGVVNGINTEVTSLDTAIKGFSGDPKALTAASEKALSTVKKGVEAVTASSPITLTDSVQIQGQVQNLQSSLESVVTDILAKKSDLVAAGQGQIVYQQLQDQMTGAKALASAISSKVPPEVKSLADTLSQGIITALQKGIDGYKDAPAGASGGSSSDSSSTSSSSKDSSSSMSSGQDAPSTSSSSSSSPMPPMSGSSGQSTSSMPSTAGTATTSGTGTKSEPGSPVKSVPSSGVSAAPALPKPATYHGAAPRNAAGSLAFVAAGLAALAL